MNKNDYYLIVSNIWILGLLLSEKTINIIFCGIVAIFYLIMYFYMESKQ